MSARRMTIQEMVETDFELLDTETAEDLLFVPVPPEFGDVPKDVRSLWGLLQHARGLLQATVLLIEERLQSSSVARHTEEFIESREANKNEEIVLKVIPTGEVVYVKQEKQSGLPKLNPLKDRAARLGVDPKPFGRRRRDLFDYLELYEKGDMDAAADLLSRVEAMNAKKTKKKAKKAADPSPKPEPVAEASPEPEPEPAAEVPPEPEPEPTPEPEPEPAVEAVSDPEPEPVIDVSPPVLEPDPAAEAPPESDDLSDILSELETAGAEEKRKAILEDDLPADLFKEPESSLLAEEEDEDEEPPVFKADEVKTESGYNFYDIGKAYMKAGQSGEDEPWSDAPSAYEKEEDREELWENSEYEEEADSFSEYDTA